MSFVSCLVIYGPDLHVWFVVVLFSSVGNGAGSSGFGSTVVYGVVAEFG